jgi:transcriptional regulator with XRE-family HTH domain
MNRKRPYPNLKTWRGHLTQGAAAAKLGISQNYYSRLERGVQVPRVRLAKQISTVTGVPLETVLGVV